MANLDLVTWVRSLKKGDAAVEPPLVSMNKLADEIAALRDEVKALRKDNESLRAAAEVKPVKSSAVAPSKIDKS